MDEYFRLNDGFDPGHYLTLESGPSGMKLQINAKDGTLYKFWFGSKHDVEALINALEWVGTLHFQE